MMRLLYVDDDEDIRAIVEMSLELDGAFWATMADSGKTALALIDGGLRPDVIVLDVMMPGISGVEVLAELRAREATAQVPVIFMTAKGRQADLALYRDLGARGVILKPFDPVTLGEEIRIRLRGE
jgi:DNA-binding response OmpR family regulator